MGVVSVCFSAQSIFVPYYGYLLDDAVAYLTSQKDVFGERTRSEDEEDSDDEAVQMIKSSAKKSPHKKSAKAAVPEKRRVEQEGTNSSSLILASLHKCFLYDSEGFTTPEKFDRYRPTSNFILFILCYYLFPIYCVIYLLLFQYFYCCLYGRSRAVWFRRWSGRSRKLGLGEGLPGPRHRAPHPRHLSVGHQRRLDDYVAPPFFSNPLSLPRFSPIGVNDAISLFRIETNRNCGRRSTIRCCSRRGAAPRRSASRVSRWWRHSITAWARSSCRCAAPRRSPSWPSSSN